MERTRRQVLGDALGLAAAAGIAGYAAPSWAATGSQNVVSAARKEGRLVFWGAEEKPKVAKIAAQFHKEYPHIGFEQFRIEPSPAIQRMITESEAGRHTVDLLDAPVENLQPLLQRKLLEPYAWSETFGVSKSHQLYGGRALIGWNLSIPIVINTSQVKHDEIKSWEDLLHPKWKGKILVEARGTAFACLATKWGLPKTLDYIHKLRANDPLILIGGSPTAEAVMSGRAAVAIGTYAGKVDLFRAQGAPIDWLMVGPIPAMIYTLAVPKGVLHPNAARVFAAWLTSENGQKALFDALHYGFMTGDHLSPNGLKVKKAGIEVVTEPTDAAIGQKYLEAAAHAIGSLK